MEQLYGNVEMEKEITEMLAEIFQPPPALNSTVCPIEFGQVVKAARDAGLDWIPAIYPIDTPINFTGMYEPTPGYPERPRIQIASQYDCFGDGWMVAERTIEKQMRTLAHELGHVYAMSNNGDFSETAADEFRMKMDR